METSESLQRTIATATELHSVVRTMKGLSSVSVRQYEHAVAALGHYVHAIELGFRILLRESDAWLVEPVVGEDAPVGIMMFGTDQGLCGPFNRILADHALRWIEQQLPGAAHLRLACVGGRLAAELEARGHELDSARRMPGSVDAIVGEVHELLLDVEAWRNDVGVERVMLVHNRPTGDRGYRPVTTPLLPVDVGHLRHLTTRPWPTRVLPTFTMDPAALAGALTREYTFVSLYRAFAESLASEHTARMAAMEAAERAIDERREQLQLRFHQVRQATISEELLDVSAGFEALRD